MNPDFLDLLAALVRAKTRFLVVGAHALAAHGVPRATFDDAWSSRSVHRVGEIDVPFLGRDALISNKRATGRTKDLADVEILERRGPRQKP